MQRADLGTLDRAITIEQSTEGHGTLGGKSETWATFKMTWATVEFSPGSEHFAANRMNATADVVFRIRYLADVSTKMRVLFNGQYYDIISVVEVGRRLGLDILGRVHEAQ